MREVGQTNGLHVFSKKQVYIYIYVYYIDLRMCYVFFWKCSFMLICRNLCAQISKVLVAPGLAQNTHGGQSLKLLKHELSAPGEIKWIKQMHEEGFDPEGTPNDDDLLQLPGFPLQYVKKISAPRCLAPLMGWSVSYNLPK